MVENIQCTFTIPAFSPLQTYTVRGLTGTGWADLRVEFILNSADNLPSLRLDNVDLQYKPALSLSGTECVPAALPQNTNLLINGSFSNGENNWGFTSDMFHQVNSGVLNTYRINTSSVGSFYQDIGYIVPNGAKLELTVEMGNTSLSDKVVNLVAHSPWDFNGYFQCRFTVPASSAMSTYAMRGIAGAQWLGIRLEVYVNPANNSPALLVDNFNLQHNPAASFTTTECDAGGGAGLAVTGSPTATATSTETPTGSDTPTPTTTVTATAEPSVTPTATATSTETPTGSDTPTPTATFTETPVPPTDTPPPTATPPPPTSEGTAEITPPV
jgi:hypothetical protein